MQISQAAEGNGKNRELHGVEDIQGYNWYTGFGRNRGWGGRDRAWGVGDPIVRLRKSRITELTAKLTLSSQLAGTRVGRW